MELQRFINEPGNYGIIAILAAIICIIIPIKILKTMPGFLSGVAVTAGFFHHQKFIKKRKKI